MIDIRIENYRLTNITKLGEGELSEKEGLAIERKCIDGNSYYVILFVKSDKYGEAEIDGVGVRLLDIADKDWHAVRKLITIAKEIIEA